MDALNLTNLMQILQLIAIVAGIIVFLRKIPSRREMEQADNILRAEIRENRKRFDTVMAKLDTNFQILNDKIDATAKTLNDKIDATAKELHEKIDALASELRTEIRELNRDYKDHLAQHAIQSKLDEQNR